MSFNVSESNWYTKTNVTDDASLPHMMSAFNTYFFQIYASKISAKQHLFNIYILEDFYRQRLTSFVFTFDVKRLQYVFSYCHDSFHLFIHLLLQSIHGVLNHKNPNDNSQ